MKRILSVLTFLLFAFCISGCLTVETKEYHFSLKKDKSGEATVKFVNIMSDTKDSVSTPDTDFQDLVDNYVNGDKMSEEFPNVKNVTKRLYEEDNQLCGEVKFEFDDITKLKFYKYKETAPWCYYLTVSPLGLLGGNEAFFSSNGTYGGEGMPIIFWDSNQKEFEFKTTMSQPGPTTASLLPTWKQKGGK